ncbi:hypothetical protein TELCIR_11916 [Teladorsagia circumcincta]|uniref:Uncharacterized protein n=1 Tax=Teladorsagia circumcincta TaxID=45464 RepID=A0A2G9U855_TELCI|nr:hypothetical protein TELCIR_11916 [Teladorsagia circumcincta]
MRLLEAGFTDRWTPYRPYAEEDNSDAKLEHVVRTFANLKHTQTPYYTGSLLQVIVSRNYRGDVEMSCIERFMPLLVEKEDEGIHSPVFCEYFKDLEEESVRDNFVVIYELFDEMMDFGYPQTTESRILQE